MARSAPRRLLDWVRILDCKLSRNEKAVTTEATPRITHNIERSSGLRPRRASRRAMRQTHFLKTGFMSIGFRSLPRSEEHTSELQSLTTVVCRLLLEKK